MSAISGAVSSDQQAKETFLAQLQAAIDAGDTVTEDAGEALRLTRERGDSDNWFVGDVAGVIDKAYGRAAVKEIAKASNYAPSTVYEFQAVAAFYDREKRAYYGAIKNLSFSHLKTAMRLKDPIAAHDFLMRAADNNYTVLQCRVEVSKTMGRPVPPMKAYDGDMCIEWVDHDGRLTVTVDDISHLQPGKRYKAVLFEIVEENE